MVAAYYTKKNEGIEAASATYVRCRNALSNETGIDPPDTGAAPRAAFEEMVTLIRAKLVHQVADEKVAERLTQDDFSFNQVLSLMRQTAIKLSQDKPFSIKREAFIREVNYVLEEEGGLTVIKFLKPSAITGRFPWIKGHLQTFLHRHYDVARRSLKHPDQLRILARKPMKKLKPNIHRPHIL